jgi:outer membrane protein TolC
MKTLYIIRRTVIGALVLILAGCTTFSEDGGFGVAEQTAAEHIGQQPVWLQDDEAREEAAAEVSRLLGEVLTPESAVQIAFLNNPGLQAAYAELGVSESDLVQAGRLPNPGFSYENTSGGGAQEIDRGLEFGVLSILTMPFRVEIETRRFQAAQLRAAGDTVDVAMETKKAYFKAVAARQALDYMREVVDAAQASRDLMARMKRVGNASRLALAREQLFLSESTAAYAQATKKELATREALVRSLGLWGEQLNFRIPERLPNLPLEPTVLENVEQLALSQRVDLQLARHDLDAMSKSLGLTKATRFVNVLEAGPARVSEAGEAAQNGYHIMFEIPVFDWGDARIAKSEHLYTQASERFREAAIGARSEVRVAYQGYRTSYDIARHYRDEIVPLRKQISDEQLLLYNGMLVGVFELIADAREQVITVNGYLEALLEYWNADTELQHALLNSASPGMASASALSIPTTGEAAGH